MILPCFSLNDRCRALLVGTRAIFVTGTFQWDRSWLSLKSFIVSTAAICLDSESCHRCGHSRVSLFECFFGLEGEALVIVLQSRSLSS